MNNEPTLRQLTNEDLLLALDRSIESGNDRRRRLVLREIDRRQNKQIV